MMIANYEVTGEWFGRLEEVVEYIQNNGYEVVEVNAEYIEFWDEDDNGYVARLGGTQKTIYIDTIVEL